MNETDCKNPKHDGSLPELSVAEKQIEFAPGLEVDRYILKEKIGSGGMGTVYLAGHKRLTSRQYAIKFIRPDIVSNDIRKRFEAEIDALEKIQHPNFVSAHDAGEFQGVTYLVMEYVSGVSLSQLIRAHETMPLESAVEVIRQTAIGLQHGYEQDLVHRDIKPSNLLLSEDGTVKILDLGLSRFVTPDSTHGLTGSLQILGTPDYMSPEQCKSAANVDIRSDIYSLGCTLYHLVAGIPPFGDKEHESLATKLSGHLSEQPQPLANLTSNSLPNGFSELVNKMLAKDPSDRFQTPAELEIALRPFCSGTNLKSFASIPMAQVKRETLAVGSAQEQTDKVPVTLDRGRTGSGMLWPVLGLCVAGLAAALWFLPPILTTGNESDTVKLTAPELTTGKDGKLDEKSTELSDSTTPRSRVVSQTEANVDPPEPVSPLTKVNGDNKPELPSGKASAESNNKKLNSQDLAKDVAKILINKCGDCHRDSNEGGFDYVADLQEMVEGKKIMPGNPDKSRIWIRMTDVDDPMPPEDEGEPLTEDELALVKEYISGLQPNKPTIVKKAAPPESKKVERVQATRTKVTLANNIEAIHGYLSKIDMEERAYQRFFLVTNLHNLPTREEDASGVDDAYLDLVRASVSKVINSLTWNNSIVLPKVVDEAKTILAIDIRDIQWDRNSRTGRPDLWRLMSENYPYALDHSQLPELEMGNDMSKEICAWTSCDSPWVRADWFVATATQPHLYHNLLYDQVFAEVRQRQAKKVVHADTVEQFEQPMNQDDLFDWLKVDWDGNIRRGRVARAAFSRSGVSSQFRMIERHPASHGYMWDSFDFKRGNETGNLNARPLGPDGVFDRKYSQYSFDHDGGEIIFGLPNGMHGYLLVDDKGDRIPFGPPDIVEDRAKTLGNGLIVNGLSCIACHKNGLIEQFNDEVRFGLEGMATDARKITRKLFLDRPELDKLIAKDQNRYRASAIEAMEPFLAADKIEAMKSGDNLIEPIGIVAKRFLVGTISDTIMAAELGVSKEELKAAVKFNDELKDLGLSVIVNGGTTNREIWQQGKGASTFQKTAQTLEVGTARGLKAPIDIIQANTIPAAAEEVAKKLTHFLVENSHARVRPGTFGNLNANGNYGPGIRQELFDALERHNQELADDRKSHVMVADNAEVIVDGTISIEDDPDDLGTRERDRYLIVKVSLDVRKGAESIYGFTFYLNRSRDIVQADGLNFSSDADDTRELHKQIRRTKGKVVDAKPTWTVSGAKIKSRSRSPYSVEIVTKSAIAGGDYEVRPPTSSGDAFPMVPVTIGETYGVRIHNTSNEEIAVALKIDGLDQFTFSTDRHTKTGRPRFSNWIVRANSSFTIKGWHLTSEKGEKNIAPFLVTKYGEGASQFAAVDREKNGVLTVAISRSHDMSSGSSRSNSETGFGPPIRQDQKVLKRKIDPPHEFLSIRYAR